MSLPRIAIPGTGVVNTICRVGPAPYYDLPVGETIITRPPRCNGGIALSYPPLLDFVQWKDWGTTWNSESCLYLEATCGDQRLCVKMAINLDEPQHDPDPELGPVVAHIVLDYLFKEANFYHDHLKELQGGTVPRHYGLWTCQTSWAGLVIFSIFEWAGDTVLQLQRKHPEVFTSETKLLCMHRLRDLHNHNIVHNQIEFYCDLRHLLYDSATNTSRIVDFSCATPDHDCAGSYPPKGACWESPQCCREIAHAADYLAAFEALSEEARDDEANAKDHDDQVAAENENDRQVVTKDEDRNPDEELSVDMCMLCLMD
ncbi:hypothetical protein ONZ45_g531 [Pleurotus djamor]|nr:hypothetical protein ONZ45_g531 [Pleurotus djamor]